VKELHETRLNSHSGGRLVGALSLFVRRRETIARELKKLFVTHENQQMIELFCH
jgi:hypothetical protein